MEKFLTVSEAYGPLGYRDTQGLYRDIREGNFTAFVRIGAKIRIPLSALQRWTDRQLAENEQKAAARAETP